MTSASAAGARAGDGALVAMLEDGLAAQGRRPAVRRLLRRPSAYGSTYSLEELDVTLDDGETLELMFKDLGPPLPGTAAHRPRPAQTVDPTREPLVYRHLLARHDLGTPRLVAAMVDPPASRYWLLTERVAGLQLCHVGDFEIWTQAARWLARLHVRLAPVASTRDGLPVPLLAHDRAYYDFWIEKVARLAHDRGSRRSEFERLVAGLEAAVQDLRALPPTVIHGEFYASNVIVRDEGQLSRICPVDWETAAVGAGVFDVAALVSGRWHAGQRQALAEAYRDECHMLGRDVGTSSRWLTLLDDARLLLAAQLLAWPRDWEPPAEHAHDWLAEAMVIVTARSSPRLAK